MITLSQQIALTHYGDGLPTLTSLGVLEENVSEGFANTIKDLIQIGLSAGAIVVTGGMDGDAIVDVLFALEESGEVLANVNDMIDSGSTLSKTLKDLSRISITQGADYIYSVAQSSVANAIRLVGPSAKNFLSNLRTEILEMLNKLVRVVGKWISAIIPDDAGLSGPIVSSILSKVVDRVSENAYDTLVAGFNSLPNVAREVIQNPNKLMSFLNQVLDAVTSFLNGLIDPKTWGDRARQIAAKMMGVMGSTAVAGGAGALSSLISMKLGVDQLVLKKIYHHLNTTVRKMIPVAVKTFHLILTNFFVQVAVLQVIMREDYDLEAQTSRLKASKVRMMSAGRYRGGQSLNELRQFIKCSLEGM